MPDKLSELTPELRRKVAAILLDLKGHGYEAKVASGLRTVAEQRVLVAQGRSKTLASKHLPGPDGLSRAADIVDAKLGWGASRAFWLLLGSSATAHGLRWGGTFGVDAPVVDIVAGDAEMGFDPAHVELVG